MPIRVPIWLTGTTHYIGNIIDISLYYIIDISIAKTLFSAFDNDGLHFSVIYDESVCSSDDICDDFRKELTATKDAIAYLNTDSRHYVYVISSGLYTRHVVRVQELATGKLIKLVKHNSQNVIRKT